MKRSLLAVLAAVGSMVGVARAQEVKYEKYSLPNGMTVILHEDKSLPVATVNIWYRVGAQDEPPGRSGFAHLFEHLMFMGTRRVAGNQFDVIMETGGGANNASTDLHRTNYYSWGPSKLLPTLLWLDADRLEDMGLEMTKEKLDKQRDVVRNELRQNVENAPYQKAAEAVFKLLYTPSHPYYFGVIGTHEDLEAANVTNVKDFFANFYVPSNASLVVAGDFDSKQIRPLVDSLFGSLSAGQPISRKYAKPSEPIPAKLDGIKRFTAIDKVELPKVEFTYHSPVAFGPGDAEMQLAGSVLGSGKSSRLYKRLVIDERLASDVSAAQQGYPLGGLFQVAVYADPGADLAKVESIIDEELARLIKDGPTAEELDGQKSVIELGLLAGLQSIDRKADRMNEYEYYWGEPNSFKRDLERFRNVTPAAVKEWAAKTITHNARVMVRVLPEQPERAPSSRDQRPAEAASSGLVLPDAEEFTLDNGLKVMVWTKRDLPLISMRLIVRPGGYLDKQGTQGLAALTAQMMGEGAADRDALKFEEAVRGIGATFSSSADRETINVSMTVLRRSIDRGAELFRDAVMRPRFDESEWQRVHRLAIDEIKQSLENPGVIAGQVGNRLFFGSEEPAGWPISGTEASVGGLTLKAVKSLHKDFVAPGQSILLIAGDLSPQEGRLFAEGMFGAWSIGESPASKVVLRDGTAQAHAIAAADKSPGKPLRLAIVDRPGATQTTVRFVTRGIRHADESRVRSEMLGTILGGSFTSRLNQNLREDKGYTYGARAGFQMGIYVGTLTAGASVKADTTGAALTEFFKEFDRLKAGDVTESEAAKARETARNDTVRGFSGLAGLLGSTAESLINGLPADTVAQDMAVMGTVTAAELNGLAKKAIQFREGILLLVGDKGVILDQIKSLGLPAPEFYDNAGNPVK